jgi:hypothetical protein
MLTLIASNDRNAHPANWAPFVVVGVGAHFPCGGDRHCAEKADTGGLANNRPRPIISHISYTSRSGLWSLDVVYHQRTTLSAMLLLRMENRQCGTP